MADLHSKAQARRAHAERVRTDCPCGRTLWGNGWGSHARSCQPYLTRYGYPLSDADTQALRVAGYSFEDRRAITAELGRLRITELPAPVWSWRDYCDRLERAIAALFPPAGGGS